MTTQANQAIVNDSEHPLIRVDANGGIIAKFAYDGDGTRRKRLDANGVIHYVGAYELNNNHNGGTQATKYYTATLGKMTRLIAFSKGGTLYYVGTDHLGGTIKVTDVNFAPLDQMRYFAFGGSRDAGTSLGTDHLFTSQIQDASIGLYWFKSRAYDPAIGRFCAPDSIVPNAMNPQALNRYSYGVNNPLRYADPTGHDYTNGTDEGTGYIANPTPYGMDWTSDSTNLGLVTYSGRNREPSLGTRIRWALTPPRLQPLPASNRVPSASTAATALQPSQTATPSATPTVTPGPQPTGVPAPTSMPVYSVSFGSAIPPAVSQEEGAYSSALDPFHGAGSSGNPVLDVYVALVSFGADLVTFGGSLPIWANPGPVVVPYLPPTTPTPALVPQPTPLPIPAPGPTGPFGGW